MCMSDMFFFFSSRRRHTRCALVTGVQTCALPICAPQFEDLCLYEFVMKVETLTQGAARLLQRHNVPKVVHDPTLQDLYARDMLTLFAPWRDSPVALLEIGRAHV